jgi:hypothetical protein
MWEALGPWAASGGVTSIVAILVWAAYKLHMSAIQAHKDRADTWKTVAEAAQARADLRDKQMAILLGREREP